MGNTDGGVETFNNGNAETKGGTIMEESEPKK